MTPEQVTILRHALGSSSTRYPLGWRNHYCAKTGDADCEALVFEGMMERGVSINDGSSTYYFATQAAMDMLGVKFTGGMKLR